MKTSLLYSRFEQHGDSTLSFAIAFIWGLAEATLFFIIPDVYLGLVALFNWRRGLWTPMATVSGAVVGGAIMYTLAANNGEAMAQLLTRIPLIDSTMVRSVGEQLQAGGLIAMVIGPLQAIPYKIYAVQAGQQHLPFIPFLFITIPARLERILPVVVASAVVGVVFKKHIQRYTTLILAAYGLLWAAIYVTYYLRLR